VTRVSEWRCVHTVIITIDDFCCSRLFGLCVGGLHFGHDRLAVGNWDAHAMERAGDSEVQRESYVRYGAIASRGTWPIAPSYSCLLLFIISAGRRRWLAHMHAAGTEHDMYVAWEDESVLMEHFRAGSSGSFPCISNCVGTALQRRGRRRDPKQPASLREMIPSNSRPRRQGPHEIALFLSLSSHRDTRLMEFRLDKEVDTYVGTQRARERCSHHHPARRIQRASVITILSTERRLWKRRR
jgi:hypothetical protein